MRKDKNLKKPEDKGLKDELDIQSQRPDNRDLSTSEAYERAVSSLRWL